GGRRTARISPTSRPGRSSSSRRRTSRSRPSPRATTSSSATSPGSNSLMRLLPGLSPLRHRDFALYWAGQCVSQIGTFIEMTATTYLLYAITSSPLLLGLGGLVRGAPILVLALFGGALADRIDRRRLLL